MKYLFVYGTLRQGSQNRFAKRLAAASHFVGHGSVQGRLYQIADYSGMVLSDCAGDAVHGDVFRIDDPSDLWSVLDEYEGSEYARQTLTVALDDGTTLAADAYLYRGGVEASVIHPEEVEKRAVEAVLNSRQELAEAYRAKFGSEISTDNAREIVSAEYAESRENRTRYSGATQKPAGALADYLFDEALRNPDPNKPPIVVMTAGGTGAGKTTAIAKNPDVVVDFQFVYDSNFGSKKSSVQKIESAKAAGNQVRVVFVHREPVEALTGGVLPRAMSEGRVVDLDAHARMYRDSAENFGYLRRKYGDDPSVTFFALDNSAFGKAAQPIPVEKTADFRYSTKELRPRLRAALEREYAIGRISEAVYRATLGAVSEESS